MQDKLYKVDLHNSGKILAINCTFCGSKKYYNFIVLGIHNFSCYIPEIGLKLGHLPEENIALESG